MRPLVDDIVISSTRLDRSYQVVPCAAISGTFTGPNSLDSKSVDIVLNPNPRIHLVPTGGVPGATRNRKFVQMHQYEDKKSKAS